MNEQRNTFLAIVLSLGILLGWQYFFAPPPPPLPSAETPTTPATSDAAAGNESPVALPAAIESALPIAPVDRAEVVAEGRRLKIETPHVKGSLSLTGARFDDMTLIGYRETTDPASPAIELLSPAKAPKPYYAELGWLSADSALALPTADTTWSVAGPDVLTDRTPATLTWSNGAGLTFTKSISADKDYMFTVEQTVENTSSAPVTLFPYALVSRTDKPDFIDIYLLHMGPLGVFNGTLKEVDYSEIEESKRETVDSTGGWIGITDKYWLTAVAFDPTLKVAATFSHATVGNRNRYQTDIRGDAITIAPGEKKSVTSFVFAGAKQVELLDGYSDTLGIARFDLAIDFGWFYFLTKPFLYALIWLRGLLGDFGLAILAFTVLLRLLAYPLANKQFESMTKLKKLQPEMQKLQERHANDRMKLQEAMMDLYKREKANPLAGCLPILIQIPVFFALYKVLFVSIEMRHAPFYGWIRDLSDMDPTNVWNLFGLLPFTMPDMLSFLHLGAWPLIYGVTMYLQQKMNPAPADPIQAKVFMFLPILFTFLLASFPSGLVIYWAWSNVLGMAQQWMIMRRMGVKM
ncbi:MAG: membrane protein insertase YidC [Alphaproteobacteria bacterium]|nr:membrane protein insertase YidC [Alphaproteobacteria bacterium]